MCVPYIMSVFTLSTIHVVCIYIILLITGRFGFWVMRWQLVRIPSKRILWVKIYLHKNYGIWLCTAMYEQVYIHICINTYAYTHKQQQALRHIKKTLYLFTNIHQHIYIYICKYSERISSVLYVTCTCNNETFYVKNVHALSKWFLFMRVKVINDCRFYLRKPGKPCKHDKMTWSAERFLRDRKKR